MDRRNDHSLLHRRWGAPIVNVLATYFVDGWRSVAPYLPLLLQASVMVLKLTVCTVVLGWVCGLAAALCKNSRFSILRWPAESYIWFIRGTPALIQIFLVYFGLPEFGIKMAPFVAGIVALGINSGAYVAEIIRGGLLSIPKGQIESARALGMNYVQLMRRIILPQVIRVIIPPITNETTMALKNTSLVSTITVMELTLQTQIIIGTTFKPFEFYISAAILYLVMTSFFIVFLRRVETRYALRY